MFIDWQSELCGMEIRGKYKTSDRLLLLSGEKRVSTAWLWGLRLVMLFFAFAWLNGQMVGFYSGGLVEIAENTLIVVLVSPLQTAGMLVGLVVVYALALNGLADTEPGVTSSPSRH